MGAPPPVEQAVSPAPSATASPSPRSTVFLIPWDADSPVHQERLRLQRVACGWKYTPDWIEKWARLQKEGKIALQWVALTDNDSEKDVKIEKHTLAFPEEAQPLTDTAITLGGKSRSPSDQKFTPVGHISLDITYEDPSKVPESENGEGVYWIATFYVSKALQRYGLGRAAMDWVEEMACREPLSARVLKLSTTARDQDGRDERMKAFGIYEEGQVSVQDWYARRGFQLYERREAMWQNQDSTGKVWSLTAVFMRKDIV